MLTIRLARRGRKKRPFYDLVAAEKARAVQKKIVARLGYLNPLSDGGKGELVFDMDLTKKYISNGAEVSQTVARLLLKQGVSEVEKFIKKRPTKPKKEEPKKEVAEEAPAEDAGEEAAESSEEAPKEETPEAPAEESEAKAEEKPAEEEKKEE